MEHPELVMKFLTVLGAPLIIVFWADGSHPQHIKKAQLLTFQQFRAHLVTLPALQKNFVNIFWCLPGNFALKNGGDFW